MASEKSIILKNDWDHSWSWSALENESFKPVFIGRDEEIERIKKFVSNSRQGSLFVSGKNGSGKTTTVCQALRELITLIHEKQYFFFKVKSKKHYLVIPINFLMMEENIYENGSQIPITEEERTIQVIKQIVRAIYVKVKSQKGYGVSEKLQLLYDDVNATKLRRSDAEKTSKEYSSAISLNTLKNTLKLIGSSALLSLILKYFSINPKTYGVIVNNWHSSTKIILDFVILISSVVTYQITILKRNSVEKQRERHGINIHELQVRITEVLKEIEEKKSKPDIIIIFDELDKYDELNKGIGSEKLLQTLKNLKLLFQNSEATFIFLIGQTTFKKLKTNPSFSTIATDKYYLSSPKLGEMKKYLIKILSTKKIPDWFDTYCNHKIFEAKGNYHSLISLLRDDLTYSGKNLKINNPNYSYEDGVKSHLIDAAMKFIDQNRYPLSEGEKTNQMIEQFVSILDNYTTSIQQELPGSFTVSPLDFNGESTVHSYMNYITDRARKIDSDIVKPTYNNSTKGYSGINWKKISLLSTPNVFSEDVRGALSDEERDFIDKYNLLKENIAEIFEKVGVKPADSFDFIQSVDRISNQLSIPKQPTVSHAEIIEKYFKVIQEVPVQDRPENFKDKVSNKALPAIKNFRDNFIDKYFSLPTNPLSVTRLEPITTLNTEDSKVKYLSIINGKRPHESAIEFSSIVTINKILDPKSFLLKFSSTINKGGILNVLIGTKPWDEDPKKREYLMLRLDARDHGKNAILFKPSEADKWRGVVTNTKEPTIPDRLFKFWVEGKNGVIRLNKGRYNKTICSFDGIKKIYWWGLANELEETTTLLELSD